MRAFYLRTVALLVVALNEGASLCESLADLLSLYNPTCHRPLQPGREKPP